MTELKREISRLQAALLEYDKVLRGEAPGAWRDRLSAARTADLKTLAYYNQCLVHG